MAKKQIRGLILDQFKLLLFEIMNPRNVVGKVQLKFWSWFVTHLHYGRSEPRHHRKKQIIRENEFEMYGEIRILPFSLVADLLSVNNVLRSV